MSSEVEKGDGSCNNYEFCSVKDVALTHFAWLIVEGNAISRVLSEKLLVLPLRLLLILLCSPTELFFL